MPRQTWPGPLSVGTATDSNRRCATHLVGFRLALSAVSLNACLLVKPATATPFPSLPKVGLKTQSVTDPPGSSPGERVSGRNDRHADIRVSSSLQTTGKRLPAVTTTVPGLLIGVSPPQNQGSHSARWLGLHSQDVRRRRTSKSGLCIPEDALIRARFAVHLKRPGRSSIVRMPLCFSCRARNCK